jgi:hypothetical protein
VEISIELESAAEAEWVRSWLRSARPRTTTSVEITDATDGTLVTVIDTLVRGLDEGELRSATLDCERGVFALRGKRAA